jgi:hypothetical protein
LAFTLFMQLLLGLVVVVCVAWRATTDRPFGWDDVFGCSVGFAGSAIGSAVIAWVSRWYTGAELTAAGVRPFYPTGQRHRVFGWDQLSDVRRWNRGVLGRFLWVTPDGGTPFVLPLRPTDPGGFREAVERFAGPDHPLTRAVAEVIDG